MLKKFAAALFAAVFAAAALSACEEAPNELPTFTAVQEAYAEEEEPTFVIERMEAEEEDEEPAEWASAIADLEYDPENGTLE